MKANCFEITLLCLLLILRCYAQSAELATLFAQKEAVLYELRDRVLEISVAGDPCAAACTCSLSACTSELPDLECTAGFGYPETCETCIADGLEEGDWNGTYVNSFPPGRFLNHARSSVRTAEETLTDQMRHEECWTQQLDQLFTEHAGDATIRWQYFGTPSGFYRIFPGVAQETCNDYDPRARPWYVAATSGPKDVMIMLDTSFSMNAGNRITLAKDAIIGVLETLTVLDYVHIITFDSVVQSVGGGCLVRWGRP